MSRKNLIQTGAKLSPLQVANMRAGLYRRVEKQIDEAHAVVMHDCGTQLTIPVIDLEVINESK